MEGGGANADRSQRLGKEGGMGGLAISSNHDGLIIYYLYLYLFLD